MTKIPDRDYPSSFHFWNKDQHQRVEINWPDKEPKKGWRVGISHLEITDGCMDHDLVVEDGQTYVSMLHPVRVRVVK